ncbi:pyridoxamine 5'-phosphate oxidase family protein [Pseudonocardia xishanensis]
MEVLATWLDEAADQPLGSTMTLATAGPAGPRARTVVVTGIDSAAVRFHSSAPTGKTVDLAADPRASAVFHWPGLGRQAVLTGLLAELPRAVSAEAYPTRPRQLQLVAWVYEDLLPRLSGPDYAIEPGAVEAHFAAHTAGAQEVPPSWTTLALTPTQIDFWRAGTADTPPARTRFVGSERGWRSFPVLP